MITRGFRMWIYLLAGAMSIFMAVPARAFPPVTNTHPLFFGTGSPSLVSARPESDVTLNIEYSSLYMVRSSQEWQIEMDMEIFLLELEGAILLKDNTELSVKVPLVSYNSGFLDRFLDEYHEVFGFRDYGRSQRPDNDYLFRVVHNGRELIAGTPGELALGDVRVAVKHALLTQGPLFSVYSFLDAPTGNAQKGYGNGSADIGVAFLMDVRLPWDLKSSLNVGYVFVDSWKGNEEIPLDNYIFAAGALEWEYSSTTSLVAQWSVQESPYDTGIREMDALVSLLSFSGAYTISPDTDIAISFTEDINTAGAPDLMLNLSTSYRF